MPKNKKTESSNIFPWQDELWQQWQALWQNNQFPQVLLLQACEGLGAEDFILRASEQRMVEAGAIGSQAQLADMRILDQSGLHGEKLHVDAVRDVIEWAQFSPLQARMKNLLLFVRRPLHVGVANSLLKILEEPPSYLSIAVSCQRLSDIPLTLRARCLVFSFPITPQSTRGWLQKQFSKGIPALQTFLEAFIHAPLLGQELLKLKQTDVCLRWWQQPISLSLFDFNQFLQSMPYSLSTLLLQQWFLQKMQQHAKSKRADFVEDYWQAYQSMLRYMRFLAGTTLNLDWFYAEIYGQMNALASKEKAQCLME